MKAHWRRQLISLSILGILALAGCTTPINIAPVNRPAVANPPVSPPKDIAGENLIALSFSGGGLRAAAFALGVLEGLQWNPAQPAMPDLLDDTTFITSVSGGSLTAAYYGLYGRAGLGPLRKEVLAADIELQMRMSAWSPENWSRLLSSGGVNDRSTLGDWLNQRVFRGATFADLHRKQKPDIWINATDLYNRTPFPFIPQVFAAICSDLSSLPVAEAVHASMAVPLVFSPVVLKTFPESCVTPSDTFVKEVLANPKSPRILRSAASAVSNYRNPEVMRYVKLVDGGLTDNYGLSSLLIDRAASGTPYGPFTPEDAIRLRQMLFVVADAGHLPSSNWALRPEGPSGLDIALIAADTATDAASRLSYDAFQRMVQDWRQQIADYRCSLSSETVAKVVGKKIDMWRCDDLRFDVALLSFADLEDARAKVLNEIPTRLTLPAAQIDAAIQGGKDALHRNVAFQRYVETRRYGID